MSPFSRARRSSRERRRAFALPAALIALVLIGVLAAGAALALARDARDADDAIGEPRALDAADDALARAAFLHWDRVDNVALPVGALHGPDTSYGPGGARAIVRATRLDAATIWFVAESFAPVRAGTGAERRVGLLARIAAPSMRGDAALTAGGAVAIGGAARVTGTDTVPAAWGSICPPAAANIAGIVAPDTTRICDGSCGAAFTRVIGAPPVLQDPAAALAARYDSFGDESWTTLAVRADVTLPGGSYRPAPAVVAGSCDRLAPLDWGDPTRLGACRDHFPLVHVIGDLTLLAGSMGQGILLVDGDLWLGDATTYAGVVIVRGALHASGNGTAIFGSVLSRDVARGAGSAIAGDTRIASSRCAFERALFGASPLVRAKERGWTQLFQ